MNHMKCLHALADLGVYLNKNGTISYEEACQIVCKKNRHVGDNELALRHCIRHYFEKQGVANASMVATYEECSRLTGASVGSLRAAAHRRDVLATVERIQYGGGPIIERTGIYLYSLARFKKWSAAELERAVEQVKNWRGSE